MFITITVTPEQADEHGHHNTAIQHAIDTIGTQRGGVVQLTAGTYILRGPLSMKSEVTLQGVGEETVLKGVPFFHSPLTEDADVGQKEVHPESIEGFLPGSGLMVMDNRSGGAMAKAPVTVQHIQDGALFINEFIINDWIAEEGAIAINYYPFIQAREVHNVSISDLVIDQKRENDAEALARDIWGAGIYCWRSEHITIERVVVNHAYGDGLRSGQSRDINWLHCTVKNCTHYGVHPGSHTRPVKVNYNDIHDNGSDGLYACWGVKQSEFCHNKIYRNGFRIHRNGFCIGHKDTDALVEHNHIYENAKHGIHVREKTKANGAHRGIYRHNIIENNGRPWDEVPEWIKGKVPDNSIEGAGIFINGVTHDLVFEHNVVRNEGKHQKRGVYVGLDVHNASFDQNEISGHEIDFDDAQA